MSDTACISGREVADALRKVGYVFDYQAEQPHRPAAHGPATPPSDGARS